MTYKFMKQRLLAIIMLSVMVCMGNVVYAQTNTFNIDSLLTIDPVKQKKIDAAFELMENVKKAGAYIESLSELITNKTLPLPIGIKKGEYELIIQKIVYDNATTKFRIHASCAFTFKENGQRIAFEGVADIEGQKGLGTNGYLELVAPIKRDLGEQATLVFMNGTKVNFGCEGIESFDAKMGLLITSEKIVAVNSLGVPTNKPVSTLFETSFSNFDQFTASFSFNNSFMFSGLDDVIFTLKGASIDQNDEVTPSSIQFPDNYFGSDGDDEKKLWRGISISEASVALPKALKKPEQQSDSTKQNDSTQRITLSLNKVIIDNNGFSAFVEANNVLHSDALPKDDWGISIEDMLLQMEKNSVLGFGFGGDLNIPPFGDNSLTPYQALYNASVKEFEFVANLKGSYSFPVFKAKLDLLETSTLEVLLKDSEIYPKLNISGELSIDAPVNKEDSTKKFSLPDIKFEQLKITREDPYVEIGSIGVSGDITSPKVAGFELSISDIKSFVDGNGSGLSFDAGIKISDMFVGEAGLQLYGDYKKFEFDRLGIDKAMVKFESKAFTIEGSIMFKNGDELYGTGFRGALAFNLIDKFKLDAIAVFGKVDGYRYFLTDAFLELQPSAGIPVMALSFYGFGGGIYQHMQQSTLPAASEFGKSLSGVCYVPDKTVGLGFMAATKFGLVGTESAFNADVSFEMQFNQYGGLNFVQLRGEGTFMASPASMGKLTDGLNAKVKALEKTQGKLKLAAKSDLKAPKAKESSTLSATMNFKFDMENDVFSADLAAYLDAGFIKGIGEGSKMGWASAYFSPDSWYTYIGTPTDRLGIDIIGLVKATSYFMVGDKIPELPLPPEKVLKNLSADRVAKLERGGFGDLGSGKGIAFGQSIEIGFNAELGPFFADIGIGLGSEFLLKNYGASAFCAGATGTLGMDGWYAKAQAWAYAEAAIGLKIKLFGKTKKFAILDVSAGMVLTGAGPNPFYFTGYVGGQYSVMGGMVSGQCSFDFEIGDECIIVGGSPFGEDVIAELTPADAEDDVNVFSAPQMVLNIPANLSMRIEEAEGLYGEYKISIEEFTAYYKDTKQEITGFYELSTDGKTYVLDPDEPFESQTDIELIARVGFQRMLNGQWNNIKDANGDPIIEEKIYAFKSGDRPDYILPEHVKYSYPIDRQYNFYPDEYKAGYLMVSENYSYLFQDIMEGYKQVVQFSTNGNAVKDLAFTHKTNSAGNDIRFELDFSLKNFTLPNNTIYHMAIINKPISQPVELNSNVNSSTQEKVSGNSEMNVTTQQAEGNLAILDVKEIYGLDFRTSDYKTLKAKMNVIDPINNGTRIYIEPNVHEVRANVFIDENFDKFEYATTDPLITVEADLASTNWYKGSVYDDMYTSVNEADISRNASISQLGYPPVSGVEFRNKNKTKALSDDEINIGSSTFDASTGNMAYCIPYWASLDFANARTYLAKRKIYGHTLTSKEQNVLTAIKRHKVTQGKYPIKVKYILPGKSMITSTINSTMYNPIKNYD